MKSFRFAVLFSLLLSASQVRALVIPDTVVQAIQQRVEPSGWGTTVTPGVEVAVFDRRGVLYRGFGSVGVGAQAEPDSRTLYELGSLTKVFTGLLFMDAVARGELSPGDDPWNLVRPGIDEWPRKGDPASAHFTLLQLATHRSGLPLWCPGFDPDAPGTDLWKERDLGDAQFLANVAATALTASPGERYVYSNLGYSLLGRALADKAGEPYGKLLEERILRPLGLPDTVLEVPGGRGNVAQGTAPNGVTLSTRLLSCAPAGGLKSTAADLVRFLREEFLDPSLVSDGTLRDAVKRSHLVLNGGNGYDAHGQGYFLSQGGWVVKDLALVGGSSNGAVGEAALVQPAVTGKKYFFAGETFGSRAWFGYDAAEGRGAVLLANSLYDFGPVFTALIEQAPRSDPAQGR